MYPYFAMLVWGIVLYLFEKESPKLHGSLRGAMNMLYHESTQWSSWRDFLPSPGVAAVAAYLVVKQLRARVSIE